MTEKHKKQTVTPSTWGEFRKTGMLWWVNRILHTFGWAIVVEVPEDDSDGPVSKVYPARVRFRGFEYSSEEEGFIKVAEYMKAEADNLLEECKE